MKRLEPTCIIILRPKKSAEPNIVIQGLRPDEAEEGTEDGC